MSQLRHRLLLLGFTVTVGVSATVFSDPSTAESRAQPGRDAGPQFNAFGALIVPEDIQRPLSTTVHPEIRPDGSVLVNGQEFATLADYLQSDLFRASGGRCGTVYDAEMMGEPDGPGSTADCASNVTNPVGIYAPGPGMQVRVVVHVIRDNTGTQGNLSAAMVQSQIDVLNEDFRALPSTPGAPGFNSNIHFALATTNPLGQPTTGIMYYNNSTWFQDGGSYWNSIAWNPHQYLNIYTVNAPQGNPNILGYATFPWPTPGTAADRVVIGWRYFGRNSPGFPYHQGRTCTHEVGHYLGLLHTFQGGCGIISPPGCYSSADLICDTNATAQANFGCPFVNTCGDGPDNVRNYMDYTDDLCMNNFTSEQARRMRCTLQNWRPNVWASPGPANDNCANATGAGPGSHVYTTIGATTDGPNEPAHCSFNGYSHIENDVWFKTFAACTGTMTVSLCGSTFNTKLAIYQACPTGPGQVIACNDNSCGLASEVTFPVIQGTIYHIRIGGFAGATGTGTMVISSCVPTPTCLPDIAPPGGDGQVNVNDLLAVINAWGPCGLPCPPLCAPDITGDCLVNVNDLLAVINAWGPCP